jgi:hypothetical protein
MSNPNRGGVLLAPEHPQQGREELRAQPPAEGSAWLGAQFLAPPRE